jgi:hypothetical protein
MGYAFCFGSSPRLVPAFVPGEGGRYADFPTTVYRGGRGQIVPGDY